MVIVLFIAVIMCTTLIAVSLLTLDDDDMDIWEHCIIALVMIMCVFLTLALTIAAFRAVDTTHHHHSDVQSTNPHPHEQEM